MPIDESECSETERLKTSVDKLDKLKERLSLTFFDDGLNDKNRTTPRGDKGRGLIRIKQRTNNSTVIHYTYRLLHAFNEELTPDLSRCKEELEGSLLKVNKERAYYPESDYQECLKEIGAISGNYIMLIFYIGRVFNSYLPSLRSSPNPLPTENSGLMTLRSPEVKVFEIQELVDNQNWDEIDLETQIKVNYINGNLFGFIGLLEKIASVCRELSSCLREQYGIIEE